MNTAGAQALDANRLRAPALAIAAIGIAFGAIRLFGHFTYGYDFAVYRVAGDAVVHHESLFGPWIGQHLAHPLPFTYPPLAAVFAVPFALIGDHLGYALWNVASVVALVFVVRASTEPLVRRFDSAGFALAVLCAIALALTPVQDEIGFGQVGIVLMAMCFFDCLPRKTRLPRGVLVGAATAIKLVPGIFIPYLWLSGRRRAAAVATATFVTLTLAGAALTPTDSRTFWTSRVFDNSRVGSIGYFSNQSLNGILVRAFGPHVNVLWFALAAAVVVFGLRRAAIASRRGQELNGIALAALAGLLASPVSWIHHLVWIVPVLAVLVGDATDRRRVRRAASIALLFALRLPYLGNSISGAWHIGWAAAVLRDSYGLLCVLLLFMLARLAVAPRAPSPQPDAESSA